MAFTPYVTVLVCVDNEYTYFGVNAACSEAELRTLGYQITTSGDGFYQQVCSEDHYGFYCDNDCNVTISKQVCTPWICACCVFQHTTDIEVSKMNILFCDRVYKM